MSLKTGLCFSSPLLIPADTSAGSGLAPAPSPLPPCASWGVSWNLRLVKPSTQGRTDGQTACAASQVPPAAPCAQVRQRREVGGRGAARRPPTQHSTAATPATKPSCLSRNSILYVQEQNCKGLPVANYK